MWLYFRFPLSFREVEELMLERGVDGRPTRRSAGGAPSSARPTRPACAAAAPAGRQVAPGRGLREDQRRSKYLWRAVDQDGNVLDILLQNSPGRPGRGQALLPQTAEEDRPVPRVVVTDKLRCYGAAHREVMPSVEHRAPRYLNNRAENSHQPTRQRERAMKGFRTAGEPNGSWRCSA